MSTHKPTTRHLPSGKTVPVKGYSDSRSPSAPPTHSPSLAPSSPKGKPSPYYSAPFTLRLNKNSDLHERRGKTTLVHGGGTVEQAASVLQRKAPPEVLAHFNAWHPQGKTEGEKTKYLRRLQNIADKAGYIVGEATPLVHQGYTLTDQYTVPLTRKSAPSSAGPSSSAQSKSGKPTTKKVRKGVLCLRLVTAAGSSQEHLLKALGAKRITGVHLPKEFRVGIANHKGTYHYETVAGEKKRVMGSATKGAPNALVLAHPDGLLVNLHHFKGQMPKPVFDKIKDEIKTKAHGGAQWSDMPDENGDVDIAHGGWSLTNTPQNQELLRRALPNALWNDEAPWQNQAPSSETRAPKRVKNTGRQTIYSADEKGAEERAQSGESLPPLAGGLSMTAHDGRIIVQGKTYNFAEALGKSGAQLTYDKFKKHWWFKGDPGVMAARINRALKENYGLEVGDSPDKINSFHEQRNQQRKLRGSDQESDGGDAGAGTGGSNAGAGGADARLSERAGRTGGQGASEGRDENSRGVKPPRAIAGTTAHELVPLGGKDTGEDLHPKPTVSIDPQIGAKLLDYQVEDSSRILSSIDRGSGGYLYAAGTGTGKTFTALGVLAHRVSHTRAYDQGQFKTASAKERKEAANMVLRRALIVVPNQNLQTYWARTGDSHFGVSLSPGKMRDICHENNDGKPGLWVVTEKDLASYVHDGGRLADFDQVVLDEAHHYSDKDFVPPQPKSGRRNPTSQTHAAWKHLSGYTRHAMLLSATPYEELWELGYVEPLGLWRHGEVGFDQFLADHGVEVEEFRIKTSGKLGEARDSSDFGGGGGEGGSMRAQYTFTGKAAHLKHVHQLMNALGVGSAREMQLSQELHNKFSEVSLSPAHHEALAQLRDAFDDLALSSPDDTLQTITLQRDAAIRRMTEYFKALHGVEVAKAALKRGQSVAIFCEQVNRSQMDAQKWGSKVTRLVKDIPTPIEVFTQALGPLVGGAQNIGNCHGGATPADRQRDIDAYQAGTKRVMIASVAAGGTGLSLHDTKGDRPRCQINLSVPWTAKEFMQVGGRSYRMGTKSPVHQHWLFFDTPQDRHKARNCATRLKKLGAMVSGIEANADAQTMENYEFLPASAARTRYAVADIKAGEQSKTPVASSPSVSASPQKAVPAKETASSLPLLPASTISPKPSKPATKKVKKSLGVGVSMNTDALWSFAFPLQKGIASPKKKVEIQSVGVHTPHHYEMMGGKRKRVVGAHPREAGRITAHSSGKLLVDLDSYVRSQYNPRGTLTGKDVVEHGAILEHFLGGKRHLNGDSKKRVSKTNQIQKGWLVPSKHASKLKQMFPNATWYLHPQTPINVENVSKSKVEPPSPKLSTQKGKTRKEKEKSEGYVQSAKKEETSVFQPEWWGHLEALWSDKRITPPEGVYRAAKEREVYEETQRARRLMQYRYVPTPTSAVHPLAAYGNKRFVLYQDAQHGLCLMDTHGLPKVAWKVDSSSRDHLLETAQANEQLRSLSLKYVGHMTHRHLDTSDLRSPDGSSPKAKSRG